MADAKALPFDDASFDVVLSTFGVMFAPDQARAAAELVRVARPGGRIGLASWTPAGFIGQLFDLMRGFVPPPPGLRSPMEWGMETRLVELVGPSATDIRTRRRTYTFRYRSAEHWVEFFRSFYGPTHNLHLGGGMTSAGGMAVDYTAGLGMGGQWIMGGMMTGTHGGMGRGMMGSGWHNANGSYGMVFTFTTA